jgi:hypothetical protein
VWLTSRLIWGPDICGAHFVLVTLLYGSGTWTIKCKETLHFEMCINASELAIMFVSACLNFLKLCKIKYYNLCLFHSVQHNFLAQTGDPTGSGKNGESVFGWVHWNGWHGTDFLMRCSSFGCTIYGRNMEVHCHVCTILPPDLEPNNLSAHPVSLTSLFILGVHCAGLLDFEGASQKVVLADTLASLSQLKVIHSVITWSLI